MFSSYWDIEELFDIWIKPILNLESMLRHNNSYCKQFIDYSLLRLYSLCIDVTNTYAYVIIHCILLTYNGLRYMNVFNWLLFTHFSFFEYNQRLYSQGGLARNDRGFEHSICACRGHSPVNHIEQICRCPGERSNAPNLCHKLPKLLNYAIYDKMTCMLHHHLLAVTITQKRIFKIRIRNTFFAAFCQRHSILHHNLKCVTSEWTLSYATLQCVRILLTLDIIQVTWHFDVQKQFQQCMQGSRVQSQHVL